MYAIRSYYGLPGLVVGITEEIGRPFVGQLPRVPGVLERQPPVVPVDDPLWIGVGVVGAGHELARLLREPSYNFV